MRQGADTEFHESVERSRSLQFRAEIKERSGFDSRTQIYTEKCSPRSTVQAEGQRGVSTEAIPFRLGFVQQKHSADARR